MAGKLEGQSRPASVTRYDQNQTDFLEAGRRAGVAGPVGAAALVVNARG
jgi:hypothetical protein